MQADMVVDSMMRCESPERETCMSAQIKGRLVLSICYKEELNSLMGGRFDGASYIPTYSAMIIDLE
jgi:hypothetical protein